MSNFLGGLIFGGAVTVVGIAVAFVVGQRRLGKHRGVSREDFVGAFAATGTPTEIPGAVYDYYKRSAISKVFSVAPDDDYAHVLSEGEEDIDDDARFLIKKLGLKIPADYAAARFETRIATLRDMVAWLDWVRRHQTP
jgi:hypothetical protein